VTTLFRVGDLGAADDRPAIVEPQRGAICYADLDRLANDVAGRLKNLGVAPGSRIGLYLRRSSDAIAAMLGTLRAGCAYVPVDPRAPVERIVDTHVDCGVQLTFVEERFHDGYRDAFLRRSGKTPSIQRTASVGLGAAIRQWAHAVDDAAGLLPSSPMSSNDDLACLLYTSGTTGQPKGWMMTRTAIAVHASWSRRVLSPTRDDVFANHAQFSFGMSLFDIYSSLSCGASLVLVPEEARQHAPSIIDLMDRERISIWFSGPAILSLIGKSAELTSRDLSALRVVAFAGEVFPFAHLNLLRERLPHPRYFNFYGSTETNVAAYYELPAGQSANGAAPMGRPCEHYQARVVDGGGHSVAAGEPGELQLRGGGLLAGYWNQPALTEEKRAHTTDEGGPWFRTGDLVMQRSGELQYAGRIGRMVKLHGYKVEPGEIEARLYEHPSLREVGVIPNEGSSGPELVAHCSTLTGERVSTVELKEFCAVKLPAYMVPARFEFYECLPRTSSGKIDLRSLASSANRMVGG
jgi:amino acid adenylation domain-containing protein